MLNPSPKDIASDSSVEAAFSEISSFLEKSSAKLVGFVQNAAVLTSTALEIKPIEELKAQFDINVFGSVRVLQKILPLLRQSPGKSRVILVGSTASYFDASYAGGYKASKMALEGICDELRVQLKPFGIGVTYLSPGTYTTDMVHGMNQTPEKYAEDAIAKSTSSEYHEVVRTYTKEANRHGMWFALPMKQPARWVAEELEFILRVWPVFLPAKRNAGMDCDLGAAPTHWWFPDDFNDSYTSFVVGSFITEPMHTAINLVADKWAKQFPASPVPQ